MALIGPSAFFLHWLEAKTEPSGWWKDPTRKVKPPRLPDEILEPVEGVDVDKLLSTCKGSGFHDLRDRAIISVLRDSGYRAAELCNLKVKDIDLRTSPSVLTIRAVKRIKSQYTYLGYAAKRAVKAWLKCCHGLGNGYLITSQTGEGLCYWGLREVLRRRSEQAGIEVPSLHSFRRAFCLHELQSGTPEIAIARLKGHSTTALIGRYSRQRKDDLKALYSSPLDDAR